MSLARLELTRSQILGHRRAAGALDRRLPAGAAALRRAAWAGLADSMPRAAQLSIHARVAATRPDAWEDPAFVQVWGPRFSAYVIAAEDRAPFTLGRLPDAGPKRTFANDMADRLEAFLGGRRLAYADAGHGMGVSPNALRYAAPTGRVLIRWDGAGRPMIWTVPAPDVDPLEARLELARRYLHVLGPGTAAGFGDWAGIRARRARAALDALAPELTAVRSAIGDGWIRTVDEASFRAVPGDPDGEATARLLPSGDAYYLLWGKDRELLVPDAAHRAALWTPRVWPGAVLVDGEVVGVWRRAGTTVSIALWRRLEERQRAAVDAEASALRLPGVSGPIDVRWDG